MTKSILNSFATWLGAVTQESNTEKDSKMDYTCKDGGTSITDMVSNKMSNLVKYKFELNIVGENKRSEWLDKQSSMFVKSTLGKSLQTSFNTGDCLIVPIVSGENVENKIMPAESFTIIAKDGDSLLEVICAIDEYKTKTSTYTLCQRIIYRNGNCTYRLYVAKDKKFGVVGLGVNPAWADYTEEWTVSGVDRMLVGRLKNVTIDPADVNAVKGMPLCFGATEQIEHIKELFEDVMTEKRLSEKMVFASKKLFKSEKVSIRNDDGTYSTREQDVLPKGKRRLIQSIDANGVDGKDLIHDWAPNIRIAQLRETIEEEKMQLEDIIGVDHGFISKTENTQYQNTDNVRKGQQNTASLIDDIRANCDGFLNDLVYTWNVLANYFNITVIGDYEINKDWSDEYLESYTDKATQYANGVSMVALPKYKYTAFILGIPDEEAKRIQEEAENEQPSINIEDVI